MDTRAITRHLREHKTMRAGIFSGDAVRATDKELVDTVLASAPMEGSRLAEEVSVDEAYTVEPKDWGWDGEPRFSIAAIDFGIKRMTPIRFAERGVRVHVLPATATLADVQAVNPDGFFMSNGPGDPATADNQVELLALRPRREDPVLRHLLRQPDPGPRPRASAPTSCATATAASTSP